MNWDEMTTFFLPRPDDPTEPCYLIFELRESWYAIDGDKLIVPITALEKNGRDVTMGDGLLSQFGGSELGMSMAAAEQQLKPGSTWELHYHQDHGFLVEPHLPDS